MDFQSALTFLKLRKQSFLMVLPASGSGELLIRSMQSTNVPYTTVRHIHLKIEIYQIKSLCLFINFDIKTFMTKRAFRTLVSLSMQLNTKKTTIAICRTLGKGRNENIQFVDEFPPLPHVYILMQDCERLSQGLYCSPRSVKLSPKVREVQNS